MAWRRSTSTIRSPTDTPPLGGPNPSDAVSYGRTMRDLTYTGIDPDDLAEVISRGRDHGGNPIEAFIDEDGGWPLRCCLADSEPGDRIAIIAWSPFPWPGAYAEVGPVVVHADGCVGPAESRRLPASLADRAMTLRPYGSDRRIAYHRVQHVTGGCYAFTARRRGR